MDRKTNFPWSIYGVKSGTQYDSFTDLVPAQQEADRLNDEAGIRMYEVKASA